MKLLLLSTFLLVSFQNFYAQKNINGKWKAKCTVEQVDQFSIRFCEICKTDKKGRSNLKPIDFELDFEKNDVTVKIENYVSIKSFELNETLGTIEFYFKDILYKFKILWTNDPKLIILQNEDQSLILLNKK